MSWLARLRDRLALDRPAEPIELPTGGRIAGGRLHFLLRPVNPGFVWLSLLAALLLNLVPWGRAPFVPDFLALVLVFWSVHQPRRVGMAAAFVFGLIMDVHNGALFGEHALAYTLLTYGAISLHRRILWFPLATQALFVLGLLLVAQIARLLARLWVGGDFPGPAYFGGSLSGALLWPLATWLLLAPQRRPESRDETRPL